MNSFWDEYFEIQNELEIITNIMRENVSCINKDMEKALLDLIDSGGKLLRPAFLLLSGRFGDYDKDKLSDVGAVIEMLHMATLIHDDIIDDADQRRGSKTIQNKYGKDYAVFMGDYLFARCFMLLSNNTSMENIKNVAKVISRICVGEIEQFSSRFTPNLSVKKYLKRIGAKTAALFSLSCYIGAAESGCDEKLCKTLGRVGYYIGMAFQIIDDILDYNGNQAKVGKPIGNDLRQGIYTLPLIFALRKGNTSIPKILSKKLYTEEDIERIIELSRKEEGIKEARKIAKKYTEKAFKQISRLPENESKEIFKDIAERLLVREY